MLFKKNPQQLNPIFSYPEHQKNRYRKNSIDRPGGNHFFSTYTIPKPLAKKQR